MKKYIVFFASVFIHICLGSVYAWSVFVPPLREVYGLTTTQTQIVFGTSITAFALFFTFAGKLYEKFGQKPPIIAGALVYAAGFLVASASQGDFHMIWLGMGFLAGAGVGLGYLSPMIACMVWFPERKGFMVGFAVAGFGAGAILLSLVAGWAFARGYDVLLFWRYAGIIYTSAILLTAMLLSLPKRVEVEKRVRVRFRSLLRQPAYWGMVIGLFSGTFAGLLVLGNLKPIGLAFGLSDTISTIAVGAFAIGNAVGRIVWGWVYDRVGVAILPLSLLYLSVMALALIQSTKWGVFFPIVAVLVGAGFGACFVLYAANVAAVFGTDRVSGVYPYVFLFYSLSGTLGPLTGGFLYDKTNSYYFPIIAAAAVALAGALAITPLLGVLKRGRRPALAKPND